uniref:Uncharacterized protein n=1 Tax=Strombidium inclinatum TaxID=197538 RepID=A0A7S3IWT8_9SPIT|mmetsp:Transcript_6520/g.10477  ORF Transcript_6520/g.10477 Transcript_6520/m.10477 type:complete len:175 (+) Transcript_6520:2-526(+)
MNSMLRSALRTQNRIGMRGVTATRGAFHKPDPVPYPEYKHTRRLHMEEVNTILYSDTAPEFYMHLHSLQIKSAKSGWFLITAYFWLIIFPVWCIARKAMKDAGVLMVPAVRPGPDHAQMAPKLIHHLQANDFAKQPDILGRRGGNYYTNWYGSDYSYEMKPMAVKALNTHGFKF